jgi:nickel/cobalt transporter (NicO) family protein
VSTGNGARSARCFLLLGCAATFLLTGATSAWAQFGGFSGMHPAPATGVFGWLLSQQAFFYQALAGMLRAAKSNRSAYWGLIGVSFIYGVFHAAGPGHGKAVISSYLLANEETWRRGVALSFASAALQSLAAIAIVAIAAFLIGATAQMMGDTVRTIETVSYVLIVLIGARLLWVKGKSFRAALHKMRAGREPAKTVAIESNVPHADARCHAHGRVEAHSCVGRAHDDHEDDEHVHADHLHHGHYNDHDDEEESVLPWGHAHGPEPEELAGPGGWRRGLSTIVAVGLRPCSGAIIILVFALSQGLFWAGIASTFVMGLGTAITVGTIASLAVGAKSFAKRISGRPTGYGVLMLRGFEVGAACLVMLVGVALLTGYMASEQMGFF